LEYVFEITELREALKGEQECNVRLDADWQRCMKEKSELQADLDWLQRNLFGHSWNGVVDSGSKTTWSIWTGYRHVTVNMVGDTFREAIAAARKGNV
jgi:hypothetical protein